MFEIGKQYLFFTCDDPTEGVGQQGGKVVAIDGPLIKIERRGEVLDIVNTHAPQFVRAERLNYDPTTVEDEFGDLLARPVG